MAINPTFASTPVLSKVKLGSTTYYLKDADLRAIVSAFGNATAQDVAASIGSNVPGLATAIQVYDFVLEKTADLAGAMHFVGVSTTDPTSAGGPTIAGHTGDYKSGDVCIYGVIEYVYDGTNWQELGDEGTWVPKSRTIAGINLQDDVTVAELQAALELGAMAYVDTASVTVIDYATGITGASYTPAGSVTASVSSAATAASLTKADYTPAGSVTGTVVPTGAVALSADANGFQISGTNASSSVSITPTTETVLKGIDAAAVAPSFTEGAFTPASLTNTSKTVATEGIVAAIDSTDTEMLVFSAAGTDTASLITNFNGGSKAADTFNAGSAATFETETVWTGVSSATAAAQTFTGGKVAATFTGNQSGDSISASFSGTKAVDALVTAVSYDKTSVSDFAFTGTAATITPTLDKGSKTITVSPDTGA